MALVLSSIPDDMVLISLELASWAVFIDQVQRAQGSVSRMDARVEKVTPVPRPAVGSTAEGKVR